MAIEASAEEALNAFVAMHGEQFRVDVHTFFEGHRGLTHDPCTIDEWNPDRRIKLLTACITDLADRARTMAASKFTVDCRYVFEKPGCLRMLCYWMATMCWNMSRSLLGELTELTLSAVLSCWTKMNVLMLDLSTLLPANVTTSLVATCNLLIVLSQLKKFLKLRAQSGGLFLEQPLSTRGALLNRCQATTSQLKLQG